MSHLVFDLESDGLLPSVSKIHCIVTKNINTGEIRRYSSNKETIIEGVKALEDALMLVGHNIIDYDIRAIKKIYPWFKPKGLIRDTLVISQLIWTNLKDLDFKFVKKNPDFPKFLIGKHSLKAWGFRLANLKADYEGGWEAWNQGMEDYCVQDVEATHTLWNHILKKEYSEEAIQLEHDVKHIILRQITHGFMFDKDKARKLYIKIQTEMCGLEDTLKEVFKPWYVNKGRFVPKKDSNRFGYVGGCPLTRVELTTFNPGSRDHIANRLQKLYGWKPSAFGADGKPSVDEEILDALWYPEAKLLLKYLTLVKRMGQLADGQQAWLKVEKDGYIHGNVNINGAVTGRMTHNKPNVAQVPSVQKGKKDGVEVVLYGTEGNYGYECRELFTVSAGHLLTGADASGLELRCLAHYMARFDNGEYAKVVLDGDIHSVNQQAAGLPTRNDAKTFIYAFLYGAGDGKIGSIVGAGPRAGGQLKKKFLQGLPALGRLLSAVKKAAEERGYVLGLDGRKIIIRSPHAALNSLLQGAGAVVMKKALVIMDRDLQELGLVPGVDYEWVANVHDEVQCEHKAVHAELIRKLTVGAITKAGDHFKFRCRLDGESKTGRNWAETH